ncbi:MAG TPA: PA14 domain-containing protein, partial [Fimbriimonadaceae bacterium]|nr:PA14 domain-containing protein [Fimbriimonadaceae bacterium]
SAMASRRFEKVRPLIGSSPAEVRAGLSYAEFRGAFDSVDDFAGMEGGVRQVATDLSVPMLDGKLEENVARRYQGYLEIPDDDVYLVSLTSDDGSRLVLSGQSLDNDGLHAPVTKTATWALAKGWHRLDLLWFNRTGGSVLKLEVARPGQKAIALRLGH